MTIKNLSQVKRGNLFRMFIGKYLDSTFYRKGTKVPNSTAYYCYVFNSCINTKFRKIKVEGNFSVVEYKIETL